MNRCCSAPGRTRLVARPSRPTPARGPLRFWVVAADASQRTYAPLSIRVCPRSFRIVFGSVFVSVMIEKNGLIISSHVMRPRYTVRLGSGLNLFEDELLKCASTCSLEPLGAKIGFVGL